MDIALITGSAGLIGSEAVCMFSRKGLCVVGIDNDMRRFFFGETASTERNLDLLKEQHPDYEHVSIDIRSTEELEPVFSKYGKDIKCIIHTAAQPSHDWAATNPVVDFEVNAIGTMNLLQLTRTYCPKAVFIFTSTNKVYGDAPNRLPLVERETRWELDPSHRWARKGIDETMSIDQCTHSLFGASKVAADVMVQEYGRYYGLKTGVFRGGCLTGPRHAGARLHGFLSYLVKCLVAQTEYVIFGYKGKQVRDNIHASDLVSMFWHFYENPHSGEVYNAGGSRHSNCSVLEAISLAEKLAGKKLKYRHADENRTGDHIWWISDVSRFKKHFPGWDYAYSLEQTVGQIVNACVK